MPLLYKMLHNSITVPIAGNESVQPFGNSNLYRNMAKRPLDILCVLVLLPLALPLLLLLALLVASDGKNPLYRQQRVGKDGRMFSMWKLRTMVPNAHTLLEGHLRRNPAARLEWEQNQKLRRDPRITPLGHILRKSSLDELPQLWNVLKGEMSLIGPRPMLPEQQSIYPGKAYYKLRPGITGLWQVSERNKCTFSGRADFDTAYDEQLSFRTDMAVLIATFGVVLRGTGC
ncbi:sugar transferase [Roseovarius sp. Pro17]|uniref:sugar transferase n=1 Tax=Roseovarius sp. Pro17 TaxID=3108175 RepID=UPI002D76FB2D|nr:sugar transferase [Roseovarius sp. Pro17]